MRSAGTIATLAALLFTGINALAQGASPCAAISDEKSRLQCYDASASPLKAPVGSPAPVAPKEDPFITKAKAQLRKQLRDPNSAKYKGIVVKTIGGKRGLCGQINAKNAFGGMTGYLPWMYDGEHASILIFDARSGNPTSFEADLLPIILHNTLQAHDKWCK